MSKEIQIITLRDNARQELMQIKSVEDGLSRLNKIKSIETWVKAEKMDAELQNIVAEQKLRTQRILGQLVVEAQDRGELRKQNDGAVTAAMEVTQVGLTHKQSSTFKKIASIPEEQFEEFIAEKKSKVDEAVKELTTAGAVRLADQLNKGADKSDQERERLNKRAKAIIEEVNEMPLAWRRRIKQSILN